MFNQVNLIGRLGKEPEIKATKAGDKFAKFSLATNTYRKDKVSGEIMEDTQWHDVTVWDPKLAVKIEDKASKGSQVQITGMIKYRKYTDKTGAERKATDIEVPRFTGIVNVVNGGKPYNEAREQEPPEAPPANQDIDDIPF
tara:strand:+ start:141 stop:563 length:423 start_codon:yes stop_codon:yes gene_type:complete